MYYFENVLTKSYPVLEPSPPCDQKKHEQDDGDGLLGDPPDDVSAASDDLIYSTNLG